MRPLYIAIICKLPVCVCVGVCVRRTSALELKIFKGYIALWLPFHTTVLPNHGNGTHLQTVCVLIGGDISGLIECSLSKQDVVPVQKHV